MMVMISLLKHDPPSQLFSRVSLSHLFSSSQLFNSQLFSSSQHLFSRSVSAAAAPDSSQVNIFIIFKYLKYRYDASKTFLPV
jgi:hypothetical protein